MKNTTQSRLLLSVVLCCTFAALAVPCYGKKTKKEPAATSPSRAYTSGDTANFITLAKDTVTALDAGKTSEMVAKLTDLETAWDAKEPVLKPKDPPTWTLLDKTLDKAISALRSSKTDFPAGKAALQDLIDKLQQATKQ